MSKIASCAIHPAIGIARVGNSPTAFFLGPRMPGAVNAPAGGFKDGGDPEHGIPPRIKRQASEFRIFALDEAGRYVRELTLKDASITWSVHVANRKAEWDRFEGTSGEELSPFDDVRRPRTEWRNAAIEDRASLIIDPGVRVLERPGQRVTFDGGRFRGIDVALGEARMTAEGHLLVLGGHGRSGRSNEDAPIVSYANNDYWYDDVSDGHVTAKVVHEGKVLAVRQAWVIVAPPDFAPAIQSVVTLWDVAYDVAVRLRKELALPAEPSFLEHVYPILQRLSQLRWVRSAGRPDLELGNLKVLSDRSKRAQEARRAVFERLRDPTLARTDPIAIQQANAGFLPALSGDAGDALDGQPERWLAITPTQYEIMKRWRDGSFTADAPLGESAITGPGMDRAALEACTGGPFYPGIEAGWVLRNPLVYDAPFQLSTRFKPGDLTKRMACPWQADFFECRQTWWPAQRPDDVMTLADHQRLQQIDEALSSLDAGDGRRAALLSERTRLAQLRRAWSRGLPAESPDGDLAMVERWPQHGFVVEQTANQRFQVDGAPVAVETERGAYDGLSWGEYFHLLMNIEDHPDFRIKARELASGFFEGASFDADPMYAPFAYSEEAFLERLKAIYDGLEAGMFAESRMDTGVLALPVVIGLDGDRPLKKMKRFDVGRFSDRAVKERVKHRAPFNLIDGAWLRFIQAVGVSDRVQAGLSEIWEDETGNGTPEKNHANVYEVLLRSLGIYLPPAASRQFLEEGILDGAFIQPVFQLSASLFSEDYLPELLGMTLYIEWESTPSMVPAVRHIRGRGFDPHFYALHVSIDNVTTGHAARARDAIREYLAVEGQRGADVQALWSRIWRGYVAWATAGDLGRELLEQQMAIDGKRVDLSYPMRLTEATVRTTDLAAALHMPASPVASFLASQLRADTREGLARHGGGAISQALAGQLLRDLNLVIQGEPIYADERFRGVALGDDTRKLLSAELDEEGVVQLNRLLLRDALAPIVSEIPAVEPEWFPDIERFHRRRVIDIIRRKAEVAKPLHAGSGLAELFDSPEDLLSTLVNRGYFNPDRPRSSRFMELLAFKGPMYKVFSAAEVEVVLDWIEAMRPIAPPPPQPAEDPQAAARKFLDWLRANAAVGKQIARHGAFTLRTRDGAAQSILQWLEDPEGLIEALVRERWVIPGRPTDSRFYRLFDGGRMASLGATDLVRDWIRTGALVPQRAAPEVAAAAPPTAPATATAMAMAMFAPAPDARPASARNGKNGESNGAGPYTVARVAGRPAEAFYERRKLIGMGAVH